MKRADREKKLIHLKFGVGEKFYRYPGLTEMNKWLLEQIKPEVALEANMTKLNLSYFRHIMRQQCSLEKTMLTKIEGSMKRRPNMRCVDSTKEDSHNYRS